MASPSPRAATWILKKVLSTCRGARCCWEGRVSLSPLPTEY